MTSRALESGAGGGAPAEEGPGYQPPPVLSSIKGLGKARRTRESMSEASARPDTVGSMRQEILNQRSRFHVTDLTETQHQQFIRPTISPETGVTKVGERWRIKLPSLQEQQLIKEDVPEPSEENLAGIITALEGKQGLDRVYYTAEIKEAFKRAFSPAWDLEEFVYGSYPALVSERDGCAYSNALGQQIHVRVADLDDKGQYDAALERAVEDFKAGQFP